MTAAEETGRLPHPDDPAVEIAYRRRPGRAPGVVFLGGFRSDMTGAKAEALDTFCAARGQAFLRLDYRGHGASTGRFEDATIGAWTDDAALALGRLTTGPQVLVGSSMGGWIALLLALRHPDRVHALLGIAAAPDFTEALIWPELAPDQRRAIETTGVTHIPSAYGDPYPLTRALFEDGRCRLLLSGPPIPLHAPVRLMQGQADPDVPWRHALRLAEAIEGPDVHVLLVKDGDHRLSRPQDLALLRRELAALLEEDAA